MTEGPPQLIINSSSTHHQLSLNSASFSLNSASIHQACDLPSASSQSSTTHQRNQPTSRRHPAHARRRIRGADGLEGGDSAERHRREELERGHAEIERRLNLRRCRHPGQHGHLPARGRVEREGKRCNGCNGCNGCNECNGCSGCSVGALSLKILVRRRRIGRRARNACRLLRRRLSRAVTRCHTRWHVGICSHMRLHARDPPTPLASGGVDTPVGRRTSVRPSG